MRAVVVDDEKLARDRLVGFLRKIGGVDVIGEAANGRDAVALIEEQAPDVVFLDVQMPEMDGFAVLRALADPPHVVFATAYDEYAVSAFDVHALDYLLKPIRRARLEEALEQVRLRLARRDEPQAVGELLARIDSRPRYLTQVPVQRGRQILLLAASEILWFEVEYRLVFAHIEGERYVTNFTLKELEEKLDPDVFFRAHKSRIVNLSHVRAIVPLLAGRFKMMLRDRQGSEVELSRAQARELRARMHW